jgi:hypothetical protein
LVPDWDFPVRGYANLKTLTPVVSGHARSASWLFRVFGAVVELQGFLRRPTSGVCDLSDNTAGEFHELGGLADEYQRTPGFTTW